MHMPRKLPPVSVIVLNYNGKAILAKAIAADICEAQKVSKNSEVILVDNASTDGSAGLVEKKFPKVRIMRMKKNNFLHSFNPAIAKAKNNTIILINNDMIPQQGCFVRLVSSLGKGVFAVGPKIVWPGKKNINFAFAKPRFSMGLLTIDRIGLDEQDRGQCDFEKPIVSLYPPIASAFDKKKLQEIGGFDALYDPAYWEDVDLGYSAWKRGWKTLYDSKAVAVHDHQQTIAKSNSKNTVLLWVNKNKHLFFAKSISDPKMKAQHALALPAIIAAGTARHGKTFLEGYAAARKMLPAAKARNKQEEKHRKLSDREIFEITGGCKK
jgi:GT2 family glycosyltransferase